MMKTIRSVLIPGLACLIGGCFGMNSISGSGKVITEPRPVSGFTSVEVAGSAKLIVEQGDTESLTITADDNLMQYLHSDVEGSKLMLGPRGLVSMRPTEQIIYRLSVKNLSALGAAGDITVDAKGIRTDSLTVAVSGAGDVTISGESDAQKIAVSGSANYKAGDFKTKDTSISISGSGKAVLAVSNRLDVEVSGSGDIEYIGSPTVTKNISGSGSVRPRTP